jgi:hypothetical protein
MSSSCQLIKVISDITEYKTNYRNVNMPLQGCYIGLPSTMTKIAEAIFDLIIKNKMYNEKGKAKGTNEDKRIYSDITTTLEELVLELYSIKYAEGGTNLRSDSGNLDMRIRELHKNNVFYSWKYKGRFIFVMEREVISWKYYNPNAFLPPKTLKKILHLAQDMMICMGKAIKRDNGKVDLVDMENSFGWFLRGLIGKLNPIISADIFLWENGKNIVEYCKRLSEKIGTLGDFDGMLMTSDFLLRLPRSVKWKIREEMEKKGMKIDKEMMDALIPANAHITRRRVGIKVKNEAVVRQETTSVTSTPVALVYSGDINPLKDPRTFIKYYRMFIETHVNSRAKFEPYAIDTLSSSRILDALIDKSKSNKEFIDAWMDYFCKNYLKGTKCMKPKYTAMKLFSDTLEDFCKTFYIPQ